MTQCTFEKSGNIGILAFSGSLSETSADELKLALLRSIHNTDNLFLNFTKVTDIDCACLQLLCSAYKMSTKMDKRISILGICSKVLEALIKKAGHSCSGQCPDCLLRPAYYGAVRRRTVSGGKPSMRFDNACA